MTTKLVRLSLEAIDVVKQHDPHHSPSQGILVMHRKLTEGLPMLQPVSGKVNEGLTEEQEERISNLIIALFKKYNSLPTVNSSKPTVNPFKTGVEVQKKGNLVQYGDCKVEKRYGE